MTVTNLLVQFLALQALEEQRGADTHPLLPHGPHQQGWGVGQQQGQGVTTTRCYIVRRPVRGERISGSINILALEWIEHKQWTSEARKNDDFNSVLNKHENPQGFTSHHTETYLGGSLSKNRLSGK